MNLETEIRQETNLCDKSGNLNLNAVGWSKKPFHRCNLSNHYLRKKKWNYWCIYDENFLVSFTISNVDYAGVILYIGSIEKQETLRKVPFLLLLVLELA